jgi:hypothetical protein
VVDVVVRVDRRLRANHAAGDRDRAIGDHLVGVHVGLGARAGLEHHQRELEVPPAVDHLLRGLDDEIDLRLGQLPELAVGERGAFLENAERADHRPAPMETTDADREIEVRALSLRAPHVARRNLDVAERVFFDARVTMRLGIIFHVILTSVRINAFHASPFKRPACIPACTYATR